MDSPSSCSLGVEAMISKTPGPKPSGPKNQAEAVMEESVLVRRAGEGRKREMYKEMHTVIASLRQESLLMWTIVKLGLGSWCWIE